MDHNLIIILVDIIAALCFILYVLRSKRKNNTSQKKSFRNTQNQRNFINTIYNIIHNVISGENSDKEPTLIKNTYLRLLKAGHDKEHVIDMIASVIVSEMHFELESKNNDLLKKRFHKNLEKLPTPPTHSMT